jgi:putative hydrolase of the HAD superfamily
MLRLSNGGCEAAGMSLRPLLLDFGGVVLLSPFELKAVAEPVYGPLAWRGPFDPSTDPEWVRFQSGEITERQYWADRSAEHGLSTLEFMRSFYEPAGPHLCRPEMVELIERHRADGRQVGMLTNDLAAFHGVEWMAGVPVVSQFHFIVDGSITGVLKPHPQSFRFALDELGDPDPASVVFVDDQPVNLAGAAEVGLTCVWFDITDPAGSVERIEAELAR